MGVTVAADGAYADEDDATLHVVVWCETTVAVAPREADAEAGGGGGRVWPCPPLWLDSICSVIDFFLLFFWGGALWR